MAYKSPSMAQKIATKTQDGTGGNFGVRAARAGPLFCGCGSVLNHFGIVLSHVLFGDFFGKCLLGVFKVCFEAPFFDVCPDMQQPAGRGGQGR